MGWNYLLSTFSVMVFLKKSNRLDSVQLFFHSKNSKRGKER